MNETETACAKRKGINESETQDAERQQQANKRYRKPREKLKKYTAGCKTNKKAVKSVNSHNCFIICATRKTGEKVQTKNSAAQQTNFKISNKYFS